MVVGAAEERRHAEEVASERRRIINWNWNFHSILYDLFDIKAHAQILRFSGWLVTGNADPAMSSPGMVVWAAFCVPRLANCCPICCVSIHNCC